MQDSENSLAGKVAIVTGSSRRIGRATALRLARHGASVVVHAVQARDEIAAVAEDIRAQGGTALVHLSDISREEGAASLIEAARAEFGRLDILVNNASIRRQCGFAEMSYAEWREIMGVILDGSFLCARQAVPLMIAGGGGAIVNLGGVSAYTGVHARAHVAAAKAGVGGLTRALAVELAEHNIRVNCVAPGRIGGERSKTAGEAPDLGSLPLLGRLGEVEEAAAVVCALCLPLSGYMTGQTVHVNGGTYLS